MTIVSSITKPSKKLLRHKIQSSIHSFHSSARSFWKRFREAFGNLRSFCYSSCFKNFFLSLLLKFPQTGHCTQLKSKETEFSRSKGVSFNQDSFDGGRIHLVKRYRFYCTFLFSNNGFLLKVVCLFSPFVWTPLTQQSLVTAPSLKS